MKNQRIRRVLIVLMVLISAITLWAGGQEEEKAGSRTLEVFVFAGPIKAEFWQKAVDTFNQRYPDVTVELVAIPKVSDQVRPRIAAGDPPDVYFIAGANKIPIDQLVSEKLIAPLDGLLEGMNWAEKEEFSSTIASGNVQYFDGVPYGIVLPKHIGGFWYHEPTFINNGWEVPINFEEFKKLCPEIASAGMAPMVTTGIYSYYFERFVMRSSVASEGGKQALLAWKNLVPGFFRSPAFKSVLERYEWVIDNGYLLEGSEGMNHVASQSEWVHGKAAFVPTGTWLEAEMKNDFPEGFAEGIRFTPSFFIGEEKEPVVYPHGDASLVVFEGPEKDLAVEFLRALYSVDVISQMTEMTNILSIVPEANLISGKSPAVLSAVEWSENAPVVPWPVGGFGSQDITKELGSKLQGLMTGQVSTEEICNSLEEAAAKVRENPDSVFFEAYFPE